MSTRSRWLTVCLVLGTGCSGRAIVGERVGGGGPLGAPMPQGACTGDTTIQPMDLPLPVPVVDVAGCRADKDVTCPDRGHCAELLHAWKLPSLKCIQADAEYTGQDNNPLQANDIQLERVYFAFISRKAPAAIRIERASIREVNFTLEGMLDMQVSDSVALENVAFFSRDEVSVEVVGGQGERLSFTAELGTVILRDLDLRGVRIEAHSVRLYDTKLTDVELKTEELSAERSTLQNTLISAKHSHLVTTELVDSEFTECL